MLQSGCGRHWPLRCIAAGWEDPSKARRGKEERGRPEAILRLLWFSCSGFALHGPSPPSTHPPRRRRCSSATRLALVIDRWALPIAECFNSIGTIRPASYKTSPPTTAPSPPSRCPWCSSSLCLDQRKVRPASCGTRMVPGYQEPFDLSLGSGVPSFD